MHAVALLPTALLTSFVALTVPPPPPQDPAPQPATDFVIEAGQHNVRTLIERAAQFLGRNYVFSEADLASIPELEVTLQNRLALDAVGCEEVVSELAFTKGLVMLPLDEKRGLYEWIHAQGPHRAKIMSHAVEMTPEQVLRSRNLRVAVRTTYSLATLEPNGVANQLRPFLFGNAGGQTTMAVGAAGNSILLQGFSHEVATAVEMIEKLEGPPPELEPGLTTWKVKVDQRLDAIEKALRR
jgi:hypothetical protein